MKVFISWSGDRSKKIAEAFYEWLPLMIQTIQPYMSSEEIGKGTRWSASVAGELESSNFGIICLTPENINASWLHFEAGALSKTVQNSRVAPLLFELKPSDVQGPLAQFQLTNFDREDITKLLKSINSACSDESLEESKIEKIISMGWDQFDKKISEIKNIKESKKQETETHNLANYGSVLEEILVLSRQQVQIYSNGDPLRILIMQISEQLNELRHISRLSMDEAIPKSHPVWPELRDKFSNLMQTVTRINGSITRGENIMKTGSDSSMILLSRDQWMTLDSAINSMRKPVLYVTQYIDYPGSSAEKLSQRMRRLRESERDLKEP